MKQRVRHRAVGFEYVESEALEELGARDMSIGGTPPFLGFSMDDFLGVIESLADNFIRLRLIARVFEANDTDGFVEIHALRVWRVPLTVERSARPCLR